MSVTDAPIRETILRTVAARGTGQTCCLSDIARALTKDDHWRALLPRVRNVAGALAHEGRIRISQNGEAVTLEEASGPIRLGLPATDF